MWGLVKKGTRAPIIAQSENQTSVVVNMEQLVEDICDAFPESVSADDFEVIHMTDDEVMASMDGGAI